MQYVDRLTLTDLENSVDDVATDRSPGAENSSIALR